MDFKKTCKLLLNQLFLCNFLNHTHFVCELFQMLLSARCCHLSSAQIKLQFTVFHPFIYFMSNLQYMSKRQVQ